MSQSNSIRKILGDANARSSVSPSLDDTEEYQAFSYGRIGNRPQLMIVFRKADGYCEGYPYSLLSKISSINPDQGFVIEFGSRTISVSGNNLERLFRLICDSKATELIESRSNSVFLQSEKDPILTVINFSERK